MYMYNKMKGQEITTLVMGINMKTTTTTDLSSERNFETGFSGNGQHPSFFLPCECLEKKSTGYNFKVYF